MDPVNRYSKEKSLWHHATELLPVLVAYKALATRAAFTVVKNAVLWGVLCRAAQTRIGVGHLAVEQTACDVVTRGASRSTEPPATHTDPVAFSVCSGIVLSSGSSSMLPQRIGLSGKTAMCNAKRRTPR